VPIEGRLDESERRPLEGHTVTDATVMVTAVRRPAPSGQPPGGDVGGGGVVRGGDGGAGRAVTGFAMTWGALRMTPGAIVRQQISWYSRECAPVRRTWVFTDGRMEGMAAKATTRTFLTAMVLAVSMALVGCVPVGETQYRRGPNPTTASIEAVRGPFATAQVTVADADTPGFGGATIYYPTSTAEGTFGAVAISPGYLSGQFLVSWYGPRLASQGFVVITFDTNSLNDFPDQRATQLLAALDYVRNASAVQDRVDDNRLAVMGHSMGGGGSLVAARTRPSIQAAIPLTPVHFAPNWTSIQTPTLIIGAQNDTLAPVGTFAEPFYQSLPATLDKAYLELAAADHLTPITANVTIAKYSIAWLKRFVDNDTRYEQFLCPQPSGPTILEYRDTCPHGT
jgi:pimeloyl-ACP methyl ester carboxylesterase